MAEQSKTSDADEASLFMRQLELLLVPLHHRFRYPLAVPTHFTTGEGGGLATDVVWEEFLDSKPAAAAAVNTANNSVELSGQPQSDRLRLSALKVIEEHVPELLTWQARVQRGAVQASNCYQVLEHVRSSVSAMQHVTESVQEQSDHLSDNASAMMVRKAKLELVRDSLEQNLAHFTHIDDLCREAEDLFLKVGSVRFSTLLQDIAREMEFLSANAQYKSAKPYAMKLANAQQKVSAMLKDAVRASFRTMELTAVASPAFAAATQVFQRGHPDLGEGSTFEASASFSLASTYDKATPPEDRVAAPIPQLRPEDVSGSFADYLAAVNDVFVKSGDSFTSLRRMVELRQGGFSYSGAEVFGEEMIAAGGRLDADPGMREMADSYCNARVGVVLPLIRYWLMLWYHLDVQQSSCTDVTMTGSVAALAAAMGSQSVTDTAVRQQLSGVAEAHALPQLAEHICVLLQRCLAAELDVLTRLWLREDIVSYLLPKLLTSIADEVYYVFRSRLLCIDDVGELSRTVESIQRVSLLETGCVQDLQILSDLWVRMVQDTQERLVFRTSVYLRQTVSSCTPTRDIANLYLRCGGDAYAATLPPPTDEAAQTQMFYLPGVMHALQLLQWLYPTLEFSVFSVFAEEAVRHSVELLRQLVKLMRQMDTSDALRDSKALLCQLAHLQYLQENLSHVDANITVVEKYLSLAALRKQRLELGQSSRELKGEVENYLLKCSVHLSTVMFAFVTQPLTGAANKNTEERVRLVSQMKGRAEGMARMIAFYVEHGETRRDLMNLLQERVAELAAEVNVDVHAVPAAPVAVASSETCVAPSSLGVTTASPSVLAAETPTEHTLPPTTTDTVAAVFSSVTASKLARIDASGPADSDQPPVQSPGREVTLVPNAGPSFRVLPQSSEEQYAFSGSAIQSTERRPALEPSLSTAVDKRSIPEPAESLYRTRPGTHDGTDVI